MLIRLHIFQLYYLLTAVSAASGNQSDDQDGLDMIVKEMQEIITDVFRHSIEENEIKDLESLLFRTFSIDVSETDERITNDYKKAFKSILETIKFWVDKINIVLYGVSFADFTPDESIKNEYIDTLIDNLKDASLFRSSATTESNKYPNLEFLRKDHKNEQFYLEKYNKKKPLEKTEEQTKLYDFFLSGKGFPVDIPIGSYIKEHFGTSVASIKDSALSRSKAVSESELYSSMLVKINKLYNFEVIFQEVKNTYERIRSRLCENNGITSKHFKCILFIYVKNPNYALLKNFIREKIFPDLFKQPESNDGCDITVCDTEYISSKENCYTIEDSLNFDSKLKYTTYILNTKNLNDDNPEYTTIFNCKELEYMVEPKSWHHRHQYIVSSFYESFPFDFKWIWSCYAGFQKSYFHISLVKVKEDPIQLNIHSQLYEEHEKKDIYVKLNLRIEKSLENNQYFYHFKSFLNDDDQTASAHIFVEQKF